MNHLPVPPEKQPSSYAVRFLGQLPGKEIKFWTYATEQGLVESRGEKISIIITSYVNDSDLYFAKIQAWLYFGLLKHVFGSSLIFDDFISERADGEKIINSRMLTSYMEEWHARSAKLSKPAQSTMIERVRECTELAWECCDQYDKSEAPRMALHMMVLFSIRILVSSLWDMLSVYDLDVKNLNESHRLSRDLVRWPRLPPSYRPLAILMTGYDWCSHEILRFLNSCNCTTVWTIAYINGGETIVDHEQCHTAEKCVARDVDPFFHQAEHLTPGCQCDAVTVEVLARIAACGWISRCWTLSEVSLAYRSIVLYAVGNRLVPHSDLDLSDESNHGYKSLCVPSRGIYRDLSARFLDSFAVCWHSSQLVILDYFAFVWIWNALTDRSTSWPDDVWCIAANLLGYSGKEIMALDEDRRLPALMRDLTKIPASFLFRNLPRSYEAPPHMRWVPRQIQGKICDDVDGSINFVESGLVFDIGAGTKFLFNVSASLPRVFSLDFARESVAHSITFKVDVHDLDALVHHVHASTELCLVLKGAKTAHGSSTPALSGNGCLLCVAETSFSGIIEADFVSSISYESSYDKLRHHFQSSTTPPMVILRCDRTQWYQPKIRRNKYRFKPWIMVRLLYYAGPTVLVSLMCATMIPLWFLYRNSHQDALILGTCGWGLLLCVYALIVIFQENFLFQNWFDSFLNEGKPQGWWKKIMPLW